MVDNKGRFPGIVEHVHFVEPDWEGKESQGKFEFKRKNLTVDIEVPAEWVPGNQLVLAMKAKLRKRYLTKFHTWLFNATVNPQFPANETGFPDDVFDAILRLWNQVSLCLRLVKE